MNPNPEDLRALLDEVLPSPAEPCGPSSADVLQMLRRERQRRRHSGMAALAGAAVALVAVLWYREAPPVPAVSRPVATAPLVIRNVNDEQLFGLLQDTPTALMEWPDGQRTLFVIVR